MKGMHLNASLLQRAEKGPRGIVATDGVVKDAYLQAGSGALAQGFGDGLPRGVIVKDVRLQPDARAGSTNVAQHGMDERPGFDEQG